MSENINLSMLHCSDVNILFDTSRKLVNLKHFKTVQNTKRLYLKLNVGRIIISAVVNPLLPWYVCTKHIVKKRSFFEVQKIYNYINLRIEHHTT